MTEKLAAEIVKKSGIMRDTGMTSATPKPRAGEHTKGPWRAGKPQGGSGLVWADGVAVADCLNGDGSDDARRIVACVNYCEGIATSFLEGASIGQPVFPEAERDTLTAQIVELTEALESALNSWRTAVLHLPGNITSEIDRIAKLRALLAKHGR